MSQTVNFTGALGDKLAARLDMPTGPLRAYALFAHCFTCSKDLRAVRELSRELTMNGFAVLRFDFTGLGHSEGEFANTNFSSNVQDLLAAARYLREEHEAPQLLVGHSLGGTAVLRAAGEIEEVKAVATIGSPFDAAHVAEQFGACKDKIAKEGQAEVTLAGRKFTIKDQFLKDIEGQEMGKHIAGLKKPLMIFHSPIDNTVSIDNAAEIFKAAKHPKSFISLDDADHLLSKVEDARYVAQVLTAWASRFIPAAEAEEGEHGVVSVLETGENKFARIITAGPHSIRADEPKSMDGSDTGMPPYDLLLSALGACTSMTVRMYADHKKWPLEKVHVRLKHAKVHKEDCEECDDKNAKIDRIEKFLRFEGDLDEEQRERLKEIAEKCPVNRTLQSDIEMHSQLEEAGEAWKQSA